MAIDYVQVLREATRPSIKETIPILTDRLAKLWAAEYRASCARKTNLLSIVRGSFEYVYDFYTELRKSGVVPDDDRIEDRLVFAVGVSSSPIRLREAARMQGWVGPTERVFGPGRDKGHFIAHTIGGLVDGLELNMFSQLRSLNRGHSEEGKRFRKMERHCARHVGTFCFHRPFYEDETACPSKLEFGLLEDMCRLTVEQFDN